jgi:hypothetical protein
MSGVFQNIDPPLYICKYFVILVIEIQVLGNGIWLFSITQRFGITHLW